MADVTFIHSIRFDNLGFVARQGCFQAVVIMTTDRATLCLVARHAGNVELSPVEVRNGLLHDAMRQLRQLPEYRTGKRRIEIALDGWHDLRQSA